MGIKDKKGFPIVKIVVCDTGPILHLREAGLLDLLSKVGKVFIPKMVDIELADIDAFWKNLRHPWISIETLSEIESIKQNFYMIQDFSMPVNQKPLYLHSVLKLTGY